MTRDGYGQAYQRGFELTVRFLLSRGARCDNASEVAQAAWVRGWERLSQLRNESVVITWVNTIALNLYRCLIRREPLDQTLPKLRGKTVGIDLAAIDVARVLTFCRPRDRILLEQYLTGVTTAEIAHQQGVTKTAIRIRLLRARRDARSRVERRTIPARGSDALDIAKCNAA